MEITLGMTHEQVRKYEFRGQDQGSQMKTTYGWYANGNETNSSGFQALPGGLRQHEPGTFIHIGSNGYWWTSTKEEPPFSEYAWFRHLSYYSSWIDTNIYPMIGGLSIRCIREN